MQDISYLLVNSSECRKEYLNGADYDKGNDNGVYRLVHFRFLVIIKRSRNGLLELLILAHNVSVLDRL
jgi:hypothetical protein